MTGRPITEADGCDVAEVGEGVRIDVRDVQRHDLQTYSDNLLVEIRILT